MVNAFTWVDFFSILNLVIIASIIGAVVYGGYKIIKILKKIDKYIDDKEKDNLK